MFGGKCNDLMLPHKLLAGAWRSPHRIRTSVSRVLPRPLPNHGCSIYVTEPYPCRSEVALDFRPDDKGLIQQRAGILLSDVQQLERRLARLADALLPTLDRIRADVEQSRQQRLAGVQAFPQGAGIGWLQRLGTPRQFHRAQIEAALRL